MRLVEPDGSVKVTLTGDEPIELVLEDIPGAGYLWQVDATGPLAVAEPHYPTPETVTDGPVGAGATRLWRINPTGLGHGVVNGVRGQPWEPAERDRQFTIEVEVLPAGHPRGSRPGPSSSAGSNYQQ